MVGLTPAERMNRAAGEVMRALRPFVTQNAPVENEPESWVRLFQEQATADGSRLRYDLDDPRMTLQILVRYWRIFRTPTAPAQTALSRQALELLNKSAHIPQRTSDFDLFDFLSISRRLLRDLEVDPSHIAILESFVPVTDHGPGSAAYLPQDASAGDSGATPLVGSSDQAGPAGQNQAEHDETDQDAEDDAFANQDAADQGSTVMDAHGGQYKSFTYHQPDTSEEVQSWIEAARQQLNVSGYGLSSAHFTLDRIVVVFFYRQSLNFGLVHNRVSPLAGAGLVNTDAEESCTVSGLEAEISSMDEGEYRWSVGPQMLRPEQLRLLNPTELTWRLPDSPFVSAEEAIADTVEFRVSYQDTQHCLRSPVRILAHGEWDATTVPELLAAHVRPRSAAVAEILDRASDILSTRTGDPSFVGYQAGSDRARTTVAAIYDAVASLSIRYATPPASFEQTGQKIRDAEEVLESRFGTCLDLTVLIAAALEEAGLNPVITVMPDHSLVGALIQDMNLTSMVEDSQETLSNLHGSRFYLPIETTLVTEGKDATFEDAVDHGLRAVQRPGAVTYVLDVRAAHRRVQPLPQVHVEGDSVVIEKETTAAPATHRARPDAYSAGSGSHPDTIKASVFPRRVQAWRNQLLDLTFRNPLLKLSDRRGVELLVSGDELGRLEDLLAMQKSVVLSPSEEVANTIDGLRGIGSAKDLPADQRNRLFREEERLYAHYKDGGTNNRLNRLRRDARSRREQTGANTLYIALGLMRWSDQSGREGRSPLFLLPVELTGSKTRPFAVSQEADTKVEPNYCLIEKLRVEHDLEIPILAEPPKDEAGIDLPLIFTRLREFFVREGLSSFSIDDTAHLAILEFSSIDLWRDVSSNWQKLAQTPVVEHLIERPGEIFEDQIEAPQVQLSDEVDVTLPMPADGSQLQAVKSATAGKTLVLEGPPGSGKSQTITNMIVDGLVNGRKILFVAEKQAALNVVADRLRRVGLEDMVLQIYGKDQSVNSVRSQIKRALTLSAQTNSEALTVLQDTLWDQIEQLAEYPQLLHHEDETKESVWTRYQRLLGLEQSFPSDSLWSAEDIPAQGPLMNMAQRDLLEAVRELIRANRRLGGPHLSEEWRLIGLTTLEAGGAREIHRAAQDLVLALGALPVRLKETLVLSSQETASQFSEWFSQLAAHGPILAGEFSQPVPDRALLESLERSLEHFHSVFTEFSSMLAPQAFSADTQALRDELAQAELANMFKRGRLRKVARHRVSLLARPEFASGVSSDPHRFLNDIDHLRREAEGVLSQLGHVLPGLQAPDIFSGQALQRLQQAVSHFELRREFAKSTAALSEVQPQLKAVLERLLDEFDPREFPRLEQLWRTLMQSWQKLTQVSGADEGSLSEWRNGRLWGQSVSDSAAHWGALSSNELSVDQLVRQHRHWAALRNLRSLGLEDVVKEIVDGRGVRGLDYAVEKAHQQHHLQAAMTKTGLSFVSASERESNVQRHTELIAQLRNRLRSQVPARLISARTSQDAASVGLRKEADRRRGGSIRQLFSSYGEEILELMPCVLMSPSAVARHLDIDGVRFDTVIFDEASQIPVADAVGALGRADAAIIVGDSKQLPPTTLFSVDTSITDEDGDETDALATADQESILSEAVGSGLDQQLLSWHYRSRDDTLITFSNQKYYDGDLAVFPSPPISRPGFGVSSHFVGGTYERGGARVNRKEAQAVFDRIQQLVHADPDTSAGVVTFNTQQRDLILDTLEQEGSVALRRALEREDEPIFVKNLENVQGDERDHILFSLGFSRDPETGSLPLNFGPLNNSGGERRLNVAVTRARQAVELYTSFYAADIKLERTRAEGVKHLRDYLLYAEAGGQRADTAAVEDFNLYREQIARALSERGLEVTSDVGTSRFRVDLAVRVGEGYGWLAVLLDSPEWASRKITSDRESLPSQVLENIVGWRSTEQVLMPDWLQNQHEVEERIAKRAAELKTPDEGDEFWDDAAEAPQPAPAHSESVSEPTASEPQSAAHLEPKPGPAETDQAPVPEPALHAGRSSTVVASAAPASASVDSDVPDSQDASDHLPHAAPPEANGGPVVRRAYKSAPMQSLGTPADLDQITNSRRVRSQVRSALDELIQIEGPIEVNRAARLVGARFGLGRVVQDRTKKIQQTATAVRTDSEEFGSFYWPAHATPDEYAEFRPRISDIGLCNVDEIAPEEIANAMESVLDGAGEISEENLIRNSMEIFGFSRMGTRIRLRFQGVIRQQVAGGRFHHGQGWYFLAPKK